MDSRPVGVAQSDLLLRRVIKQKLKYNITSGQSGHSVTFGKMMTKRHFVDEDFCCPVCRSFYNDPVLLPCGHSGCKECIRNYWTVRESRHCPVCRKVSTNDPPLNLALRNLCRSFLDYKRGLEELCEVHQQKFCVFCCDDKKLLCELCRDSEEHRNHTCRPIREVAEEHRGVYHSQLDFLNAKLKVIQRCNCMEAGDIQVTANLRKRVIHNEFRQLHQLLDDEETRLIEELQQEKELKLQIMKDKIRKMDQDIMSLSNNIKHLEETLEGGDITLLQTLEETSMSLKFTSQDPEMAPGELIDCAKYLGNLKFNVWKKIGESISYSPVVLDPNTANYVLALSDDLTEVWNPIESLDENERKFVALESANLERFQNWPCVLGSVGFSTGIHSWDVEVKDNNVWTVGVAIESVQRKGDYGEPSDVWCIGFDGEMLSVKEPLGGRIDLSEYERPKQVRVKLDLSEGQVSFSDPQSDAVYHTFTHNFTEKVFPYFHTERCEPHLRILPVDKSFY